VTVNEPITTPSDSSIGELVARLSEQTSRLVRDEMRLAQAEMKRKGRAAGLGLGLLGGAGVLALFGLGTLIAAAVLALSLAVSAWLAALIVGVVVLAVAGIVALAGKKDVSQATPPAPTEALRSTKEDIEIVKRGARS
jgi:hypothetical protein